MPVIAFGDIDDVGRRVGMALAVLATGALAGPPISGAINRATGGFKFVGYYAGLCLFYCRRSISLIFDVQDL
jgi:MFS transporter, MCT family, solute carrier family 16 (monocarboxylic acid transporters), member 10